MEVAAETEIRVNSKETNANKIIHPDQLTITRPVYTYEAYKQKYPGVPSEPFSFKSCVKERCKCTRKQICQALLGYFPVINFIRKYKVKEYILGDFLSGLTVSFLHLPLALGIGILAGLKPIHGLYSTFFSVLNYMIFGTSPYVSIGVNAVMAIVTRTVVEREADAFIAATIGTKPSDDEIMDVKVGVSMACCVMVGAILMGMGLLKLGFITTYLSPSFVGGFTTAAAIHIASSQVPKVFGIKVQAFAGAGKLIRMYIDLFGKIAQTNPAEITISASCALILLLVKVCINEKYHKKMKIPIPIDIIVMVIGTIISHFAKFEDRFRVTVAGEFPSGFMSPALPRFQNAGSFVSDVIVMAVLCLAMSISMAKLCAVKHSMPIDDNQEMIAYGACNFLSGFFFSFPSATAPPRAMILSTLGARTTLNAIPTSVFMLLVILVIGQLFVSLPLSVLAVMIIVAMKDLLLQYRGLPRIWRINKYDFIIWVVTNAVSVLVDLDYGIIAGVGISIILVIVRDQCAKGRIVNLSQEEDTFVSLQCKTSQCSVKIFRIPSNFYFATAERIKAQIFKSVGNPSKKTAEKQIVKTVTKVFTNVIDAKEISNTNDDILVSDITEIHENKLKAVIIDLFVVGYIDMAGLCALKEIVKTYQDAEITVYLAGLNDNVIETLTEGDFFKTYPKDNVLFDAIEVIREERGRRKEKPLQTITRL